MRALACDQVVDVVEVVAQLVHHPLALELEVTSTPYRDEDRAEAEQLDRPATESRPAEAASRLGSACVLSAAAPPFGSRDVAWLSSIAAPQHCRLPDSRRGEGSRVGGVTWGPGQPLT